MICECEKKYKRSCASVNAGNDSIAIKGLDCINAKNKIEDWV